MQDKCRRNFKN